MQPTETVGHSISLKIMSKDPDAWVVISTYEPGPIQSIFSNEATSRCKNLQMPHMRPLRMLSHGSAYMPHAPFIP